MNKHMPRIPLFPDCPFAAAVVALLVSSLSAAPLTTVTLTPASDQPTDMLAPVTFGLVLKAGDVPKEKMIAVYSGGKPVNAQIDVKRHNDDGSVRFAIISLFQPVGQIPPERTVLEFIATDAKKTSESRMPTEVVKKLLAGDFDAAVTLKFPDGKSATASVRKLLAAAGDKVDTWLTGPIVTEFLLMGHPVDADGQTDPDLNVQFQVRCYEGGKAIRVSVVVENCQDTWAGNIGYDVAITLGKDGKVVLNKSGVDHEPLSRWRKVFWYPAPLAEVHVAHDPASLFATRALPNFDLSFTVPEKSLENMAAGWASWRNELMGPGFLARFMGMTGGRDEINFYPVWTVRYLLSMDPRAKEVVLGHGNLAGSWPIHVRNSKTGRIMTIDERPEFWLDGRGKDKPAWKPARKPLTGKGMQLQPDGAHVGSFAFVPFLATGDYYYMEEAFFWANHALLSMWSEPRQNAKGIMRGQVRGDAWTLRNIGDAGFIAPDASPEARYFEEKIHNNLAWLTQQMYGPPERNANGYWGEATHNDHANEMRDAPKPWMLNPPWQVDYLIWSVSHLAELGYADAVKPRDFLFRWRIGLFTHPEVIDPVNGTAYRMVVGEMGPNRKVLYYDDWRRLAEENAIAFPNKKPEYRDYYDTARAAIVCAVDVGYPKAEEALKAVDSVVVNGKTLGEGRVPSWIACPKWSIVPRPK